MTTDPGEELAGGAAEAPASPGIFVRLLLRMIGTYQAARAGKPSGCRFWPSCSEYAKDALVVHGVARGGVMSLRRLGRCRPLGPHGVDPVPPKVPGR